MSTKHHRNILYIGLLVLLLLSGCGGQGGEALSFETIDQGDVLNPSGRDAPRIVVVTSQQEIDQVAQDVMAINPDIEDQRWQAAESLRQLNYETTFAVLVLQGTRTAGSQVTVQRILWRDNTVQVYAKFATPWV